MVSELRQILEQAEHRLTPERQQILAQRIRSLIDELEEESFEKRFDSLCAEINSILADMRNLVSILVEKLDSGA